MTDTIAAIATPPATGAIGIIRLSGPGALAVADHIFYPYTSGALSSLPPRRAHFGRVLDADGRVLDKALALVFPAPHSYTGEDCVELQCHGGLRLLDRVLSLCLDNGARQAEAGEFTKRAFLNGRLDLTEAEAVADLIHAETLEGVRNAAGQLSGRLFDELNTIYHELLDITSHFTAYIDYTDEGVEPPDCAGAEAQCRRCAERLAGLAGSFSQGRLFTEGVRCAIIGRPNAGKSSLLNALCGFDRSIVTDLAGTTRDTVEETVQIGPVLLRLIDTAGLRSGAETVEQLGIERTRAAVRQAGLIVAVFDGAAPFTDADREVCTLAASAAVPVAAVVNKSDLPRRLDQNAAPILTDAVSVSAVTGRGLDLLRQRIRTLCAAGTVRPDGGIITNRRQAEALQRAADAALRAADALRAGFTPDVAWVDAEAALSAIGEITGKTVNAEILSRVFERFCVGK